MDTFKYKCHHLKTDRKITYTNQDYYYLSDRERQGNGTSKSYDINDIMRYGSTSPDIKGKRNTETNQNQLFLYNLNRFLNTSLDYGFFNEIFFIIDPETVFIDTNSEIIATFSEKYVNHFIKKYIVYLGSKILWLCHGTLSGKHNYPIFRKSGFISNIPVKNTVVLGSGYKYRYTYRLFSHVEKERLEADAQLIINTIERLPSYVQFEHMHRAVSQLELRSIPKNTETRIDLFLFDWNNMTNADLIYSFINMLYNDENVWDYYTIPGIYNCFKYLFFDDMQSGDMYNAIITAQNIYGFSVSLLNNMYEIFNTRSFIRDITYDYMLKVLRQSREGSYIITYSKIRSYGLCVVLKNHNGNIELYENMRYDEDGLKLTHGNTEYLYKSFETFTAANL